MCDANVLYMERDVHKCSINGYKYIGLLAGTVALDYSIYYSFVK